MLIHMIHSYVYTNIGKTLLKYMMEYLKEGLVKALCNFFLFFLSSS